jgi:hypothetical protein
MPRPQAVPNCPPGLEYLMQLDRIQVQQIPSLVEAFIGWETNNKYVLRNSAGQQFLYAMEGKLSLEERILLFRIFNNDYFFQDTDTCMRYALSVSKI